MSHPLGRVHIVGIGGAGMSALARLLMAQGASVSGSDAKTSRRLTAIAAEGATVFVGHDRSHVVDSAGRPLVDTVAASTAVPSHNLELVAAREAGIAVLSRADLLCAITDGQVVAAVAGTHGKTTTTSMLTVALQSAGLDPSFAIGSELGESGSNAHLGSGEVFAVEADESDGTFLRLAAKAAIVTNVEPDHLNYWQDYERLRAAFAQFVAQVRERDGFAVVCVDDADAAALVGPARALGVDVRTYGQAATADYRVQSVSPGADGWAFEIWHGGEIWLELRLNVPGVHNVLNATAAAVTAAGLGAGLAGIQSGLAAFRGARRRFDFKGQADGVRVYDDYAHHPTEIAATLRAAREVVGTGRLVVAFEAHHYYRTALFSREFGQALGLADEVVVLEVYAPGEEFIPGASGLALAEQVPLPAEQVLFEPSWSKVAAALVARSRPGDLIMTLGAGDIGMLAADILAGLREREAGRVG